MLDDATLKSVGRLAGPNCNGAETAVPRLGFWSGSRPTGHEPAMFDPKIYMVLQGAKRMTIAGAIHDFGPGDCGVAILGLPFRYEIRTASPERPYLGVGLTLDPGMVASVLLDMPGTPAEDATAFAMAPADQGIRESMSRLVRLAFAPEDVPVLAPLNERELLYRLLCSPLGGPLRRIAESRGNVAAIRRAADRIRTDAACPMRVADIANEVGMSQTSFHRQFKAVTGLSPLAYQRHVRLLDAQRRLTAGSPVTTVAYAVGYRSASQFSREYRQMFDVPPRAHLRSRAA